MTKQYYFKLIYTSFELEDNNHLSENECPWFLVVNEDKNEAIDQIRERLEFMKDGE